MNCNHLVRYTIFSVTFPSHFRVMENGRGTDGGTEHSPVFCERIKSPNLIK